jgi:hypothetical protein
MKVSKRLFEKGFSKIIFRRHGLPVEMSSDWR